MFLTQIHFILYRIFKMSILITTYEIYIGKLGLHGEI